MKPRIAFPFVGDSVGGSHRSASLLMSGLMAEGFDVLALVHRDGPLVEFLNLNSLPLQRVALPHLDREDRGTRAAVKLARAVSVLVPFLRRRGISLVHANDGRMITTWMPAARIAGVPGVAHLRTKWSRSGLASLGFLAASASIVISSFVRDSMPPKLRHQATIIPNPFAVPPYARPQSRLLAESVAGGDGTLIAFIGTLQTQKRPEIFLRASALILQREPRARFLMIGRDGGMLEALQRLANDLGIADRLYFTGYRADAQALLAGCDLLLAPAVDEGHGRSLIEAMLLGVPVVASDSGGHREIIRNMETGFLVPADDAGALGSAALAVLHNTEEENVIHAACQWATDAFDPAEHVGRVMACYADLGVGREK